MSHWPKQVMWSSPVSKRGEADRPSWWEEWPSKSAEIRVTGMAGVCGPFAISHRCESNYGKLNWHKLLCQTESGQGRRKTMFLSLTSIWYGIFLSALTLFFHFGNLATFTGRLTCLAFLSCDSIFDQVFKILVSICYGVNMNVSLRCIFCECLPFKNVLCSTGTLKPWLGLPVRQFGGTLMPTPRILLLWCDTHSVLIHWSFFKYL